MLAGEGEEEAGGVLQDQRGIDAVDVAVAVHVRTFRVGQCLDQTGAVLQHERRVDAVDGAASIDVAAEAGDVGRRGGMRGRRRA